MGTGVVDEVLVVDNNAEEGTAEEVAKTKARIVEEPKQGYGHATRRGMLEAEGDLIVLAEPDGTFLPQDIHKLLVYSDECDAVFGTRTTRELIWAGANMDWYLRWGNWGVAKLMEVAFDTTHLSDVGCTYRLFRRPLARRLAEEMTIGGSHAGPELMLRTISGCQPLHRGAGQLPAARRLLVGDGPPGQGDHPRLPDDPFDHALPGDDPRPQRAAPAPFLRPRHLQEHEVRTCLTLTTSPSTTTSRSRRTWSSTTSPSESRSSAATCPAGKILDVGCGTGALAERLAGEGYEVTGVDPSDGMLDVLRERAPSITAVHADGTDLPFADDTFDLAYCVAVMHHVAEPRGGAARRSREMVRVTRSGGRVLVWDHNPRNPYWSNLMGRVPQDTGDERLIPEEELLEGLRAGGAEPLLSAQLGLRARLRAPAGAAAGAAGGAGGRADPRAAPAHRPQRHPGGAPLTPRSSSTMVPRVTIGGVVLLADPLEARREQAQDLVDLRAVVVGLQRGW